MPQGLQFRRILPKPAPAPAPAKETPSGPSSSPPVNDNAIQQHSEACKETDPPDAYHTCLHPYHQPYFAGKLPSLLFRLEPPASTSRQTNIPFLVENGKFAKDQDGFYIRDFWFLPRFISRNPPAWLLEFWFRSDLRLTCRDVKARMTDPRSSLPSDASLMNLREYGVRRPLGLSCWDPQGSISKTEVETVARLSYDQISFNTTMHVEYSTTANAAPLCLVDRSFDPSTSQRFDLNTFLDGRQRQTPSANMKKCMTALFNPEPRTESRAGIGAGIESLGSHTLQQQQQASPNLPSPKESSPPFQDKGIRSSTGTLLFEPMSTPKAGEDARLVSRPVSKKRKQTSEERTSQQPRETTTQAPHQDPRSLSALGLSRLLDQNGQKPYVSPYPPPGKDLFRG